MNTGQNHLNSSSSASIRVHLRLYEFLLMLRGVVFGKLPDTVALAPANDLVWAGTVSPSGPREWLAHDRIMNLRPDGIHWQVHSHLIHRTVAENGPCHAAAKCPDAVGIQPGASARRGLGCAMVGIMLSLLTTSCSHSAPLLSQETPRGKIQYSLHSPEAPARQRVILAHGFFRSPDTMDYLAESLAKDGIETACIKLKRSTPFNGNHDENARDLIALRESLGWKNVIYAGFSAAVHKSVLRESSAFLQSRPTSKP